MGRTEDGEGRGRTEDGFWWALVPVEATTSTAASTKAAACTRIVQLDSFRIAQTRSDSPPPLENPRPRLIAIFSSALR